METWIGRLRLTRHSQIMEDNEVYINGYDFLLLNEKERLFKYSRTSRAPSINEMIDEIADMIDEDY